MSQTARVGWNQLRCLGVFCEKARFGEVLMERRAFLQLLCIGMGMVSAATATKALTLVEPLNSLDSNRGLEPMPSVATPGHALALADLRDWPPPG